MKKIKFSRQQLQSSVASMLYSTDGYDNLKKKPLYLQTIYKEKANIILKAVEICIINKHDMQEFCHVICDMIQNGFVSVNVASNSLLNQDSAYFLGTITKDEAQGKSLPDDQHSDLYLYLGKEYIDKIGAEKLLAYDDLSLNSQLNIITNLIKTLRIVNTVNKLSTKAEEKGYSLNAQIENLYIEHDKMIDLHNKE